MTAVSEITQIVPKTQISGSNRRLITVAEYDRMTELGFFDNGEKVELLNGEIIEIMAKGTKHAIFNDLVADILSEKLGENVYLRNQNPITLDDFSEPEPDIVLAKPPRGNYFEKHPTPEDIYLVMEISDTTLAQDRETKSLLYARAGIVQYLLLNVNEQTIEDYREPNSDGYEFKQTHRIGDKFNLVAFPETEIKVSEILIANAEN
jgi:Uma2 family endonuclease